MGDFRTRRLLMVERDIAARGISDRAVLDAMRDVPREDFVDEGLVEFAFDDGPLPIGAEQTISQPYIVAVTLAALKLTPGQSDRVLDVGTGSGYSAALLSRMARDVYTIERVEALARSARARLERLGYHNVQVMHGDGTLGWSAHAPYDGIAVAAGGPRVPQALLQQLVVGGRLVMPVGSEGDRQMLVQVTRLERDEWRSESLGEVRFVPLIGANGFGARLG
jgi:protein-L-isoaspartate(D-aspartate) O-methyltransferase